MAALESFTAQTVDKSAFEVIVIDDGSTDDTESACLQFEARLPLRYVCIEPSGISAAKNKGASAAAGELLLFADDDDLAAPTLFEEHLRAHSEHSNEALAVLGYTGWWSSLLVTPLMRWATDVGEVMMGYGALPHGSFLNYEFFWGGRSSCKRAFFMRHGGFNPAFSSFLEDIELGYRLSWYGLAVYFNRNAVTWMARPISLKELCRRSVRQGHALALFGQLYGDDAKVQNYCARNLADPESGAPVRLSDIHRVWNSLGGGLEAAMARAEALGFAATGSTNSASTHDLFTLYQWVVCASRLKGAVEGL